ncbi:MAG: DUF1127 domain-containing protein [Ectothiorhodospiraceae bacterium]|nr:DUF1127 domain-containing protein [Ectothiorhodospiraceae bacterium]MCH8518052.1 DUF1127 domain-containing protein [Cyclobacteriaceae bacterium]
MNRKHFSLPGTETLRHLELEDLLRGTPSSSSLWTRIAEFALRREKARQNRLARRQLSALDDRLLRDIGIRRQDIRSAKDIFKHQD